MIGRKQSPKNKEKMDLTYQWLGWTDTEKIAHGYPDKLMPFSKVIKVSYPTLMHWKKEYLKVHTTNIDTALSQKEPIIYDSKQTMLEYIKTADEELKKRIKSGKATSKDFEFFYKYVGLFKEKSEVEVKIGLSPDEVARRNLEATRQLNEGGYRVDEVQEKPGILPEKLCLLAGQGETAGSEMATLGTLGGVVSNAEITEADSSIQE